MFILSHTSFGVSFILAIEEVIGRQFSWYSDDDVASFTACGEPTLNSQKRPMIKHRNSRDVISSVLPAKCVSIRSLPSIRIHWPFVPYGSMSY